MNRLNAELSPPVSAHSRAKALSLQIKRNLPFNFAGFVFSMSTITLRSVPRLQFAAQIASGSFLFFGSQYTAADALINEKNGKTSQNYGREL